MKMLLLLVWLVLVVSCLVPLCTQWVLGGQWRPSFVTPWRMWKIWVAIFQQLSMVQYIGLYLQGEYFYRFSTLINKA